MKKVPLSEEVFRMPRKKAKKGYVLVQKAITTERPMYDGSVLVVEKSNGKQWYCDPNKLVPHS